MRKRWWVAFPILFGLVLLPAIIRAQGGTDLLPDRSVGVLSADPGYGERWSTSIFPFGNYTGTISGEAIFCRTYLHFPLGVQPGAVVPNATLFVYVDDFWPGPGGAPMSVHPVLQDWTVEGVDWTDMGNWPSLGAPVATIMVTSSEGWFAWDVTSLVQAWVSSAQPNYGLAIAAADPNAVTDNWAAARRLTANSLNTRPYLTYSIEVPATATIGTPPPAPVPTAPPPPPAPAPTFTPTPIPVLLPETGRTGGTSGAARGWWLAGLVLWVPIFWALRRRRTAGGQ